MPGARSSGRFGPGKAERVGAHDVVVAQPAQIASWSRGRSRQPKAPFGSRLGRSPHPHTSRGADVPHDDLSRDEQHQDGRQAARPPAHGAGTEAPQPRQARADDPLERERRRARSSASAIATPAAIRAAPAVECRAARERDERLVRQEERVRVPAEPAEDAAPADRRRRGWRARRAARRRPRRAGTAPPSCPSRTSDRTVPTTHSARARASRVAARAQPGVGRRRRGVHPARQRHAERELRQPGDEDRAPRPGIEVVVEDEQARPPRTTNATASVTARKRAVAEPAEHGPEQRVDRARAGRAARRTTTRARSSTAGTA